MWITDKSNIRRYSLQSLINQYTASHELQGKESQRAEVCYIACYILREQDPHRIFPENIRATFQRGRETFIQEAKV